MKTMLTPALVNIDVQDDGIYTDFIFDLTQRYSFSVCVFKSSYSPFKNRVYTTLIDSENEDFNEVNDSEIYLNFAQVIIEKRDKRNLKECVLYACLNQQL